MDYNPCYNDAWTAADAVRLVQVAPYTRQSHHRHYPCLWMTNRGPCGSLTQCCEFSEHLRTYHGVTGPDRGQVTCCWDGCFTSMKKESLMRHINEKHLELKFRCDVCDEQFTRNHTMKSHMRREHSN